MHDSGGELEMMVDINAQIGVPFRAQIFRGGPALRLAARLDPGSPAGEPARCLGNRLPIRGPSFAELMGAPGRRPGHGRWAWLFADIRDGYYLSEDYAAAMLAAELRGPTSRS